MCITHTPMNDLFEWNRILFNDQPLTFLLEVVFRSAVMFIVLLLTLKLAGKRGVRQLSIFEIVIIISLGSAAGDPMFYEEVGIIPAVTVFIVVISLYRLVTWLTGKSKKFETFIEGKPECLVHEGRFSYTKFEKASIAQDEFFMELRMHSIEHLGQVKYAYIEPSGSISVFFYADEQVKPGLPLLPEVYNTRSKTIPYSGTYSCSKCGFTTHLDPGASVCTVCHNDEWVPSIKSLRIA